MNVLVTALHDLRAGIDRSLAPAAPVLEQPTVFAHCNDIPPAAWRWQNFRPAEIACRGDGSIRLVPAALDRLQALRGAVDRPLRINSAYRSPLHNARVGGAPKSRHKIGDAFDISLNNIPDRDALRRAAEAVGFSGFGLYRTFLHVDCGPSRTWGSWS